MACWVVAVVLGVGASVLVAKVIWPMEETGDSDVDMEH